MTVRHGIIWLALLCAYCAGAVVRAQNPAATQVEVPPAGTSEAPAVPKPAANDVIPLKNANGEIVPVLRTPTFEEFLKFLEDRRQKPSLEPSMGSVASISLTGSADGDLANLQVTMQIQILAEDRWIRIPLRLNEGTLRDQSYSGPGEAAPAEIDPDQGYLWWLKGKGLHVLKFNLIVPLRKELPSRRLQLTLPPTIVSELKLRVPIARLIAKGDEQGRARLTLNPTTDGATMVEMVGLGPRLDLTWQPQPDLGTVDTVLEARTAITATIDGRTMLLEANQRLAALQGTFNQVQVRLPRGGELLKIEGDLYKESTIDPKDPTQVVVTLKDNAPTTAPVDLKWTVRVEIPSQSERILIEGFEVAKAKIQTGHLAIRLVGDYRLERIDGQNQFVQRDNLSTLEKAVPAFPIREDVSSAYSILRQPFQLAFNLQPEKPHITVTPRLFLSVNADRMELFGEYDVQVYRWSIEEVKFAWPGWKDEGWKLDPVAPANQVEETRLDDPNEISVKLIERKVGPVVKVVDRTSATEPKQFTLLIHASRALSADQPGLEFTLPSVPAANMTPADFALVLADNLEADLRPLGDTATRLQTVSQSTVPLPKNLATLRRRDFRLDAAQARFSVATTVQKQRIGAQTEVDFSLDGSELKIEQRISYDVAYERLSQVLLMVPEQLLGRASFVMSVDGMQTPLVPISTGGPAEGLRRPQRLTLGDRFIGKFDVIVQATLPVTWPMGAVTTGIDVPLVLSTDTVTQFSSTRIRVHKPKRQRLSVTGDGWTPQAPQNGAAVWLATARQSSVSLQCEKSDGTGRQGSAVPRRLVQAVYSVQGEVYCQARYYLAAPASVLRITFPAGSSEPSVRWGQTKLDAANIARIAGASEQYQITLPETAEDAESGHLLTLTYELPKQSPMDTGESRRLAAPVLLSDGTPTQTFWQIQLPVNQHLWTLPTGFTPEFDWQRMGSWWSRMPRHSSEALEQWVSGNAQAGTGSPIAMSGNRYLFSSLEGPSEMSFHTLSAPLIVLIGASLALLLGFVLVNVPSTRHVLTLLWLGFLTTLAALWYSEPVLVLLQPAGLGLVLALLASVAQRWFRKSRMQPVLTLAAPSDILTATSSREEAIPPALIGDQPTQSHPPAFPMTEAGVGI